MKKLSILLIIIVAISAVSLVGCARAPTHVGEFETHPTDADIAQPPLVPGDWYNTPDGDMFRWNGSEWLPMDGEDGENGQNGAPGADPPVTISSPLPGAGDTVYTQSAGWFWQAGDYIEGSRTVFGDEIVSIELEILIGENNLGPFGECPFDVLINGTVVGSFSVLQGDERLSFQHHGLSISGEDELILRMEVTQNVAAGQGSFTISAGNLNILKYLGPSLSVVLQPSANL